MKKLNVILMLAALAGVLTISACSDDDVPPEENEEEVIDEVKLIFSAAGEAPLEFTAEGPGGVNFVIPTIILAPNTEYDLAIELRNTEEGENITTEVEEEGAEHMFFFEFTDGLFSNPAGDGNVDSRGDAINYNDEDDNGQPVGLSTTWTTGDAATGNFRVILKHQPDIKTATSTASDGESDVDLEFGLEIE